MDNSEKIALIKDLRDNYDHAFLDKKGVEHFSKPFGFMGSTYEAFDSRDEIKGLTLPSGPGTSAIGADAADLAEEIAYKVCGFKGWQMGRGSRLRSACDTVLEHLENG